MIKFVKQVNTVFYLEKKQFLFAICNVMTECEQWMPIYIKFFEILDCIPNAIIIIMPVKWLFFCIDVEKVYALCAINLNSLRLIHNVVENFNIITWYHWDFDYCFGWCFVYDIKMGFPFNSTHHIDINEFSALKWQPKQANKYKQQQRRRWRWRRQQHSGGKWQQNRKIQCEWWNINTI